MPLDIVYVDIRGPAKFKADVQTGLEKRNIAVQCLSIPRALKIEYLEPVDTFSAFESDLFVFVVRVDNTVSKAERDRLKELTESENSQVFVVDSLEKAVGKEMLDQIADIVLEHMD